MKLQCERLSWVAVLFVTFLLRFLDLELKPLHFDESVNGWFVGLMWEIGHYKYDPVNFHGPLYFYFLQVFETLFGFGISSLRLTSVVASLGIVGIFYRLRHQLGKAALWAAAIFAVSPGFVFYGRTAIHELTFVFFQLLAVAGWVEWRLRGQRIGVGWTFLGFVGCFLLKETSIIFVVIFFLAWQSSEVHSLENNIETPDDATDEDSMDESDSPWSDDEPTNVTWPVDTRRSYQVKSHEWPFWITVSLFLAYTFYSGFFQDPDGLANFFRSLLPWLKEGVKGSHEKPFWYYLKVMAKYETLLLISLLFTALLWRQRFPQVIRFFVFLGLGLFLIYTMIPYKTPWLVLSFVWPFCIFFGFLLEQAFEKLAQRFKVIRTEWLRSLLALCLVLPLVTSVYLNWWAYDDDSQEYVYVQSRRQFSMIYNYLDGLTQKNPSLLNSSVEIYSLETWPLPYIFRNWTNVTWRNRLIQKKTQADLIICEEAWSQEMEQNLSGKYWRHELDVRSGREKMVVFVRDSAQWLPLANSADWRPAGT